MNGDIRILLLFCLPLFGSFLCYALGRGEESAGVSLRVRLRDVLFVGICGACLGLSLWLGIDADGGEKVSLGIAEICGKGMNFTVDGFRGLYLVLASLAWLMTALFSMDYMRHGHHQNRYYFFVLFTMAATLGVFLSADLYTTFLFFEAMSLASYVWVAQEEDADALKASKTYLAVAVIGGLVMLMGLFLLEHLTGTLMISELYAACQGVTDKSLLYVAGGCLFFGFGAKAGCFPLHIWLPKAHPVAPAPASALLSGILTKSGIFGVLVLVGQVFRYDADFGLVVLWLGTATMVIGAVLALFSVDIKHILACSSVSQIGFVLVGAGAAGILGEENALAVRGTVLHMVNHSLFKLILFQVAGVVVLNLGARGLNEIRGFGRGKKLFAFGFLMGALGIAGVPLFSGYVSKTLLHEALVECYRLTGSGMYRAFEWIFLLSGGCTLAYMLKLFVVLFVRKPSPEVLAAEKKTRSHSFTGGYLGLCGRIAIAVPSVLIPVLGIFASRLMDGIADRAQGFAGGVSPEHAVSYYSLENLKGSLISIVLGLLVYALIVRPATERKTADGELRYENRWPSWLYLEDLLYRPLLLTVLPFLGAVFARTLDKLVDGVVRLLKKTLLRPVYAEKSGSLSESFCNLLGHILNGGAAVLNATFRRKRPIAYRYVERVNRARVDLGESVKLVSRSLSYGLLAFCLGLLILLVYLIVCL